MFTTFRLPNTACVKVSSDILNAIEISKKEGDMNLETNIMKAINKDNKNNVEERFTNDEKKIDKILIKINNNHLKESKSSYAQATKKQAATI